MKTRSFVLASVLAASLISAFPKSSSAQMPPPPGVNGVNTGLLSCNLSPTIGLIIGSLQTMHCIYRPVGPFPPENYVGTFGTLGIDVGITLAQGLAWQVYSPTVGPLNGALAGAYVGPSAELGIESASAPTCCSEATAAHMPCNRCPYLAK